MKKLIIGIVLVFVMILMAVTCPKQNDHQDAFRGVITETVTDEINSVVPSAGLTGLLTNVVGGTVVDIAVDKILEGNFTVHNYLLFSVGEFHYGDKSKYCTFGIFNQVFTPSKEDLEDALHKAILEKLNLAL